MKSIEHFTGGSVCGCPEWWAMCPDPDTSSLDSPPVLLTSLPAPSILPLIASSTRVEGPHKPQPPNLEVQSRSRVKKLTKKRDENIKELMNDLEAKFWSSTEGQVTEPLPTPLSWASSESSYEPMEDDEPIQEDKAVEDGEPIEVGSAPKSPTASLHPLQDHFHEPSTSLRPPNPTQGGPCRLLLSLLLPGPTGHPRSGRPAPSLPFNLPLSAISSPLPSKPSTAESKRLRHKRWKERSKEKKRLARAVAIGYTPAPAPVPPNHGHSYGQDQGQLRPQPRVPYVRKRNREPDERLISLRGRRYGSPTLGAFLDKIGEAGEDGEDGSGGNEETAGSKGEEDREMWFLEGFEDLFPADTRDYVRPGRAVDGGEGGEVLHAEENIFLTEDALRD
ncbi:hypothetical protein W97_07096 [Coniosporium apollinis CBS 100218]|uniref:Uncharacterized protein n=1 Tax=Coniosporium apollinis (strain CBS 100218) TaxID=1168221 RepID=R7Z1N8_CONA1|nr:uncharacterized protein W97_07096 [Coniosporium apollinis CBS 100218]EON67841.1 hypothetical protein W97_07096 [Coniosporium apollinis CBS 100218]